MLVQSQEAFLVLRLFLLSRHTPLSLPQVVDARYLPVMDKL